jgi:hypothetical protein
MSVLFEPRGIAIRHQVQPDAMLKEGFEAREHQGKPLR